MGQPFTVMMTRPALEAKRAQLANQGIVLANDSGQFDHSGCTIVFSYFDPTLTIQVVDKPWIVSESKVENKIRELLEG